MEFMNCPKPAAILLAVFLALSACGQLQPDRGTSSQASVARPALEANPQGVTEGNKGRNGWKVTPYAEGKCRFLIPMGWTTDPNSSPIARDSTGKGLAVPNDPDNRLWEEYKSAQKKLYSNLGVLEDSDGRLLLELPRNDHKGAVYVVAARGHGRTCSATVSVATDDLKSVGKRIAMSVRAIERSEDDI